MPKVGNPEKSVKHVPLILTIEVIAIQVCSLRFKKSHLFYIDSRLVNFDVEVKSFFKEGVF